jgi:hypothetical protein
MADKIKTQIKLGPAIGSYANIFKPRAIDEKSEPKYSISLLFDKKTADKQLKELRAVCEFVAAQKFGPKWKSIPKFHLPIRDGDVDKSEHKEYAGKLFCNASSKRQPGIVFVAAVNVFPFEKAGNKGVALGLNNLLVFEKGTRIDGQKDASEDFAEYAGESEPGSSDDENPLD